ncbi:MAG: hypothetical protein ABSH00_19075 [Bryobacteraceae bacterium]|jgi:MFS-type transporter involved in bile tolerance (Atg22 family)
MANLIWALIAAVILGGLAADLKWTHEPVIVGLLILWFIIWAEQQEGLK